MNKKQFFTHMDEAYDEVGETQIKGWIKDWLEERFGGYIPNLRPVTLNDLYDTVEGHGV